MKIPYYHVDVFTSELFKGNPAGVCLLGEEWLETATMQAIAAENNLSETVFVRQSGGEFALRWFTPGMEIDLCGHATVAPAHIFFNELQHESDPISFDTISGEVRVTRSDDRFWLDFPSRPAMACLPPDNLEQVMGRLPTRVLRARDYLFVYESEADILSLNPDFAAMRDWDCLGIIATAPGHRVDFVSRFFAPAAGVDEDPVTGSAHCTLIPYWSEQFQRESLHAMQVSRRGGELFCRNKGERVHIGGRAVTYLRGELEI